MGRGKRANQLLDSLPEPKSPQQQIVVVTSLPGANLLQVEDADGRQFLCRVPASSRNQVWVLKGGYLIVDLIAGDADGDAVGHQATLAHHLYRDQIKHLKSRGLWPAAFDKDEPLLPAEADGEDDDLGDELHQNTNRRGSLESEEEDEYEDDEGAEENADGEEEDALAASVADVMKKVEAARERAIADAVAAASPRVARLKEAEAAIQEISLKSPRSAKEKETGQQCETFAYEGEYNDAGQMEGRGTCRFVSGNVYEGEWKAGLKDGFGEFRWAAEEGGSIYIGEWSEGNMHGKGEYRYANGNVYEGSFVDGAWEGEGSFRFSNGDVFAGVFRDHKKEGLGTHRFASGEVYEGEYKEDERHGRGTWRAANGDMWVGGYEVGAKEGVGTWLYADGATSISLYKADEPFGEGVRWNADAQTASRLKDGEVKEAIDLAEAQMIAAALGVKEKPQTPKKAAPDRDFVVKRDDDISEIS